MRTNLKDIYHTEEILKEYGYFDTSRIASEILKHCKTNHIKLEKILKRIKNYEPWEYIKGETEFYGNKFLINHNTLIPRIETEQLVSIANDLLANNTTYEYVIDVGTGSGCIIISLVKNLCIKNNLKYIATDVNSKALEVAKSNSVLHKVNKRIRFITGNLLDSVKIRGNSLIVANLPYIPTEIYKKLDKSVREYEPRNALDGGYNGLRYYKELLDQVENNGLLEFNTTLLMEIDPTILNNLKKLVKKDIQIIKDFREIDRFALIHLS